MPEYPKVLYRCYGYYLPPDGLLDKEDLQIYFEEFKTLKETPCGVWIGTDYQEHLVVNTNKSPKEAGCKWVSLYGRKRFAYPTKEEALNSFEIRKKRQIQHCNARLIEAKKLLEDIPNVRENL